MCVVCVVCVWCVRMVCSHFRVPLQIAPPSNPFDPPLLSSPPHLLPISSLLFSDILGRFFKSHSPHTASPHTADYNQYMIGIWWHDESQKEAIEEFVKELEEKSGREVRTPILPLGPFYEAEVSRREEREKGERERGRREREKREKRGREERGRIEVQPI